MRVQWLVLLGCAILSLPAAATASTSPESSAILTLSSGAANAPAPWSSAAWSSGSFPAVLAVSFSGTAPASNQWYGAITPALWTAQDTISAPPAHPFTMQPSSSLAPVAPECWRPASISNAWDCSVKPITRYDLPLRHALRHLWPLRGNKNR